MPEFTIYDGDPVRFIAAPIWAALYYPILASLVGSVAVYLIDLVRPWRTITVSAFDLTINLLDVVIIVAILRAGHYVDVSGAAEHANRLAQANYWINTIIRWVFITVGVATIWDVLNELWKMLKSRRTGALAL